jgi:hypothetical protein
MRLRRIEMKLNPPTTVAFWISVVLAVLGLLGSFVTIPFVSGFAFWFVVVGYLVLLISLFVKGM